MFIVIYRPTIMLYNKLWLTFPVSSVGFFSDIPDSCKWILVKLGGKLMLYLPSLWLYIDEEQS